METFWYLLTQVLGKWLFKQSFCSTLPFSAVKQDPLGKCLLSVTTLFNITKLSSRVHCFSICNYYISFPFYVTEKCTLQLHHILSVDLLFY